MKRTISGICITTILTIIVVTNLVHLLQKARYKNFMKICLESERDRSYCEQRWTLAKWGKLGNWMKTQ